MSHTVARRVAYAAAAAAGALATWSALVEPRWVEVRHQRIELPGLPEPMVGLRIGLLADLHAGRLTPLSTLRRAVDAVMAARPDVVAVAGDLADRRPADLDRALAVLAGVNAPLGAFAVPGNHDRDTLHPAVWSERLAAHPTLEPLDNRYVMRDVGGARLCIAGVDDLVEGRPRLTLPPFEARDLTVLLAHQPDHARLVEGTGVDLMLSGHTHGGQIRIPGMGPVHRKSEVYDQGLAEDHGPRIYTTRGVGTTFLPLRFGARPEVSVLELVPAT